MNQKLHLSLLALFLLAISACDHGTTTTSDACTGINADTTCNKWDQLVWDSGKWAE